MTATEVSSEAGKILPSPPEGGSMTRRITSTKDLFDFLSERGKVAVPTSANAEGYTVVCPTHPDGEPSLWINPKADGRVGIHCRAGCLDKDAIIEGLGLTWGDFSDLEVNGGPVSSKPRATELVGDEYLSQVTDYFGEAQARYLESDADRYCRERFKIDPEQAQELGLGFDPGSGLGFGWVHQAYKSAPRLVVPFRDFDGRPVGFQGRAVADHGKRNRWVGPTNPPGRFWSTVGVFDAHGDDHYWCLTEGPSDALTAVGVGVSAVCCRGASLAQNDITVATLINGLTDKKVVLAGDADHGGEAFNAGLGVALSDAGIQTHQLAFPGA